MNLLLKTVIAVVVALALVYAYLWWTSDERAIRNQLSSIAESLTVDPNDGALGPVTRVATLRRTLAPDVRVSVSAPQSMNGADTRDRAQEIVGREAILGAVSRWNPPGGALVDFVDVDVSVNDAGSDAQVSCTVRITSPGESGEPIVDTRPLAVSLTKIDGTWLVASATAR